jgi:hypothetical protein
MKAKGSKLKAQGSRLKDKSSLKEGLKAQR